jgi:hypothetical protein
MAQMLQFAFGLAAGIVVGLVMEWIVDWRALAPRLGRAVPRPTRPQRTPPDHASARAAPVAPMEAAGTEQPTHPSDEE